MATGGHVEIAQHGTGVVMVRDSSTRATLLERLSDGADALAWDEFFQRYWRLVFVLAKGRGCSDHTAEEIVQEVMLATFDQRDVFRYDPARGRFRDWLCAVVRNKVAELRRRPSERMRTQAVPIEPGLPEPADNASPEDACDAAFEQVLLAALLDVVRREVHARTYQAFELLALGELPGATVARITGLSRNAVYQARKNVVRRLRELGAAYRGHGPSEAEMREALRARPSPAVERVVASRTRQSLRRP